MKQTVIDKNTLLPISLLGTIIAAAVWMTMLFATANENAKKIARLEQKDSTKAQDISQIKLSIVRIEESLKYLVQKEKDHDGSFYHPFFETREKDDE